MDAVKIYEEAARKVGRGEINLMEFWKNIRPLKDVEVVRHGRWIDKSGGIEGAWNCCSVCGEEAIDLYDYCPNCGAKMDEKDGEGNG